MIHPAAKLSDGLGDRTDRITVSSRQDSGLWLGCAREHRPFCNPAEHRYASNPGERSIHTCKAMWTLKRPNTEHGAEVVWPLHFQGDKTLAAKAAAVRRFLRISGHDDLDVVSPQRMTGIEGMTGSRQPDVKNVSTIISAAADSEQALTAPCDQHTPPLTSLCRLSQCFRGTETGDSWITAANSRLKVE